MKINYVILLAGFIFSNAATAACAEETKNRLEAEHNTSACGGNWYQPNNCKAASIN